MTTRRRTSDLERETERLSGLTAAQRLAEHQFFIDWLPDLLPPTGWALDGDVARLAHGMPVVPERYSVAVAAEVAEHELVRKLRDRWDADFEIRTVAELPPIVHVEAGGRMVPLLPIAALPAIAAERGTS